jgi:hypothetical protein
MSNCAHEHTRILWSRINGSGEPMRVRQLRAQCQECGELVGSSLRHELAAPDTPEAAWEERLRELQRQREEKNSRWWDRYHARLRSEAWREKRQRVLLRAGGIARAAGRGKRTKFITSPTSIWAMSFCSSSSLSAENVTSVIMADNSAPKPRTYNGDIGTLPSALAHLRDKPIWVNWSWVENGRKYTKVPRRVDDPSINASTSDPATWGAHKLAVKQVRAGKADGIGSPGAKHRRLRPRPLPRSRNRPH